ncbi:uncharacterized protein LOC122988024 [Thunnus albacares]|uniref:uncharacterized protein LOC122988024 n=1 Tax=Thunnus albacares TaxID=8236 RepID=UPI001CF62854|nr:uncharacterized protein LOC122988024 [Thunnus albacares]
MLCPAAVSAAAAAVWLLAVLGPCLSLTAEDNSEPGFTLCSHCFYRQTPPRGASAGPLLHPLCHRLPGGQAFATLHRPTCDTAVYSAFHLSHGWTEREGLEGEGLVTEEEENIIVPALLRGGKVSPTDSPLQHWDSTVTSLVQSGITPQCSILGGDLYILIGAGGFGTEEDGDEECQMKPLWSAVCCAVPEGKGGVSVGLIRETGEGVREVSVKELEEMLGVTELFSEGCGGADGETVGMTVGLNSEGNPGNIEKLDSDTTDQDTEREGDGLDTTGQDSNKDLKESGEKRVATLDAQPDEADVADVTRETSAHAVKSESSDDDDAVEEDTKSSSTVIYILSTILSILTAPLRLVFSTITQLPGQVSYVLQEDLGVLSALPGDTYSLFHLLTSDLFSWTGSAVEMLLGIGEACFFSVYYCSSSILEALLNSCQTGVTGMGTLAEDTVGIFVDSLDNAWCVTKFFGGRLWEQSEGYVGTVVTEVGGQAKAVGGGLGTLAWRSGNGVGNVFRLGGGLIMGMVDMVTGAVREAFGQESE